MHIRKKELDLFSLEVAVPASTLSQFMKSAECASAEVSSRGSVYIDFVLAACVSGLRTRQKVTKGTLVEALLGTSACKLKRFPSITGITHPKFVIVCFIVLLNKHFKAGLSLYGQ